MDQPPIEFLQNLQQKLHHLMKTADYTDVTFNVEDEQIHCHKNVLALSCPYFDTMFKSQITGQETKVIEIKTIPKDLFKQVIEFAYTGVLLLNEENAQNCLEIANLMQYEQLKERCCGFLMKEMDPSNCFGFLELSSSLDTPDLYHQTFKFTCDNFEDAAMENEEFLEIEAKNFDKMLTNPHINVRSEDFIVEKAMQWMEHCPEERIQVFVDVMSKLPLQMVSPHFLQNTVLKNAHVASRQDFVSLVQGVINHGVFLAQIPIQLMSCFPRTRTEYVEGVAFICKEYINTKTAQETRTKLKYYRFENEDVFSCCKSEDADDLFVEGQNIFRILNDETSLCSVDNAIYLCNNHAMQKYDMPTKQWTICTTWPKMQNNRIFMGEGKRLFCIEYSNYMCPVSEYKFAENKWEKICTLKRKLTTSDFAVLEFQGLIYIFGGNEKYPDMIQSIDLHTGVAKVLSVTLPSAMIGMNSKVYKHKAIITGHDATYIIDLVELGNITKDQDPKTPNTPGEQKSHDSPQHFNLGEASMQSAANNETQDMNDKFKVIIKPGVKRVKYCLEQVGNKLVLAAGKTHHPKFCKEVDVADIDDIVSADKSDISWKTVAMLSKDLNRYNISLYRSVTVRFKQC